MVNICRGINAAESKVFEESSKLSRLIPYLFDDKYCSSKIYRSGHKVRIMRRCFFCFDMVISSEIDG